MHESGSNTLFIRAICLPEMKKHTVYKTVMKLDSKSYEIDGADCEYAAGNGTTSSCKHKAALYYALEDFSRKRQLPSYLTCTDRLQTWNQPRPRKLQPIPVENLRTCKYEIMPSKLRSSQQTQIASQSDPRSEALRKHGLKASRCSLSLMNTFRLCSQ